MRTVSAADANRHFSNLLQQVKAGETITVTSRGRPVAQIVPAGKGASAESDRSKQALLARLRAEPVQEVSWSRAELYDDTSAE
jgi:prevent-host-death family protein